MLNLVSDSSCDLISGELNSPYARLTVAPMCLHVGGQDYLDTPELDIPAVAGASWPITVPLPPAPPPPPMPRPSSRARKPSA